MRLRQFSILYKLDKPSKPKICGYLSGRDFSLFVSMLKIFAKTVVMFFEVVGNYFRIPNKTLYRRAVCPPNEPCTLKEVLSNKINLQSRRRESKHYLPNPTMRVGRRLREKLQKRSVCF